MCDHCGCRQGSVQELMDQHEVIASLGGDIRRRLSAGDEAAARERLDVMLAVLRPHVQWEESGLFARMSAQLDAAAAAPSDWGQVVLEMLADLDEHIYRENFGLFPGAIAVLDADDWDAIEAARPNALRGLSRSR